MTDLRKLISKKSILIIVCVGVIVFSNSLFNGFIQDDYPQVIDNLAVHSLKNAGKFFTGGTFYNGGRLTGAYYRPIQSLVYALIYSFVGANAFTFHLFQILFHILNTVLLFLVLKHFFRKQVSFILSLIFLVHPINSESVFYIATLQDILYFFFGMLSVWIIINFKGGKQLIIASLCLLLSLLSKETGIVFAGLLLVYCFIFDRKRIYQIFGVVASVSIFYIILRAITVGFSISSKNAPISNLRLLERMINMPAIFFFYLKTFIFPLDLASSYHWIYHNVTFRDFFLPFAFDLLFLIVMSAIALFLYKKHFMKDLKIYTFFCLWFFIGILLHLQIIPLDMTVTEHWFYFPIVGILGMIGVLLSVFQINVTGKKGIIIVALFFLLLSIQTFVRSFDWRNNLVLDSHDVSVSKDAYDLENGISFELLKQGKLEQAKIHAEKSVRMYPYITNLNTLGLIYLNLGDYKHAKETYVKGLKYGDYYMLYENLGGLTLLEGDFNENVTFLNNALKKFPYDAKLWLYLALLEYNNHHVEEAKVAVQHAYFYDQSLDNQFFYEKIMNNQPININFNTSP